MKKNIASALKLIVVAFIFIPCIFLFCGCEDNSGLSAYDIAVKNGFVGTETEWLESLKGEKGEDQTAINSLYDSYKENTTNPLEFDEWYSQLKAELKGDKGETGENAISFATNTAITSVASIYSGFDTNVYYYHSSYFSLPPTVKTEKVYYTGAGVLFKADNATKTAYYITNYHVVYGKIPEFRTYGSSDDKTEISGSGSAKKASEIKIYYYGMGLVPSKNNMASAINAQLVGGTLSNDIAVLKVSGSDYDKLMAGGVSVSGIGDSSLVHAGDTVVAIGNPEGEGISVTSGIISVDRESLSMTAADGKTEANFSVMRIDAAVNGGNSGGGLFDKEGKLIGIVNAKTVATEIEGMNYAIPVNLAINIANNIITTCNGTTQTVPQKCIVGISTSPASSKAVLNKTTGKVDIVETVSISKVEVGSAAANANLQVGDVIKSITYNNKKFEIKRYFDLSDYSFNFTTSGATVTFEIERDNQTLNINVTLGVRKDVE